MTKSIPLTKGKFAIVDDEDFEWLNQWVWHAEKSGNTFYAVRNKTIGYKRKTVLKMHRVIMNTPEGMETDHIDMDGLNNQKSNLRNATKAQNRKNRIVQRNNHTGYKGVGKDGRYYRARIKVNGKTKLLGYFVTAKEAAWAYDEAAAKYHGEYARLNFPERDFTVV